MNSAGCLVPRHDAAIDGFQCCCDLREQHLCRSRGFAYVVPVAGNRFSRGFGNGKLCRAQRFSVNGEFGAIPRKNKGTHHEFALLRFQFQFGKLGLALVLAWLTSRRRQPFRWQDPNRSRLVPRLQTSLAITPVAGAQRADLLLIQLTLNNASAMVTPPAGWTELSAVAVSATGIQQRVHWMIRSNTEPAELHLDVFRRCVLAW